MTIYYNSAVDSAYVELNHYDLNSTQAVLTDDKGEILHFLDVLSKYIKISFKGIPEGTYLLTLADGSSYKISKE